MGEIKEVRNENFIAGLVGAFLGSLLGTALIVLLGQMGYVAAVSGLVMAVCSLKGYEKLGGAMSKKGVIASSVIMLIMTYIGNRIDWGIAASKALDIGVLDGYRVIPELIKEGAIESGDYWSGLVLLYLFTLVGAVPTVIAELRGPKATTALGRSFMETAGDEDVSLMKVYAAERKWITPYYVITTIAAFSPLLWAMMITAAPLGSYHVEWFDALIIFLPLVLLVLALIKAMPYGISRKKIFVRHGGVLWYADLELLNRQLGYSFIKNRNLAPRWDKLSQEEQTLCKRGVLYAINTQQGGDRPKNDPLARSVCPLRDLQVLKNGTRKWKVQYEDAEGRVKKLKIPKVYPDLVLENGMEPMERAPRVDVVPVILLVLSCMLPLLGSFIPEPSAVSKNTVAYDLGPLHFKWDEHLAEDDPGVYVDSRSETIYVVDQTLYGLEQEDIRPLLEIRVEEMRDNFNERTSSFLAPEGELLEVEGPNGETYLYDRYLFATLEGEVALGYAVYLPQKECVVRVETVVDGEPTEDVHARILAMLGTLEVDPDGKISEITDLALTEETYQNFFAPAVDYGYSYVGRSYLKAPKGMFEGGEYTDIYLPYSEDAVYNEDGTVMTSRAHGVQLDVTFLYHTGTAGDVAKELAQQIFEAEGRELVGDLVYDEDLNVGIWVAAHEENGIESPMLFYADVKKPEYYLAAVITYYPEEADELSDALLEELSDAYALNLPSMSEVLGEEPAA